MELLKINLIRAILFLIFYPLGLTLRAQSEEEITLIKKRYTDESVVFLKRSMTLNLFIENDSLKAYTDIYEDLLLLKNQTEGYTKRKVYGSSFSQVENLKAKTLVWEKNKYKEVPVSGWTKKSDAADHVFYDDTYYYAFNYPSVAAGNRTQLEYREILKDVRMLSGYLVSSYAPQVSSTFTIKTSPNVDLHFEVLNDSDRIVRFKKTEKGKVVQYEWTAEHVPSFKVEEGSPAVRYYEPHIQLYVKSFKTNGKTVEVLPNLDALHFWYRSFLKNQEEMFSTELRSVVNSIKEQSSTELDLVKNIFNWVQANVQYIAFEDGMRGFVPNSASYTCEKRYGDCKDMASLIVGMLKVAGVNAYPTWIGTRDIPYRYSQFPTPYVDNHMIATYISPEGKYYFLDATDQYIPFGLPTDMIQGKEALISVSENKYTLKEVPVIGKEESMLRDSIRIWLDSNNIIGEGHLKLDGYTKGSVGHQFNRMKEKEAIDFISRFVGKGNNKFYLDDYKAVHNTTLQQPAIIDYKFRIGDYFQRYGDELYINLHLSKDNYNRFINEEIRKTPHEFEYKYTKSEVIEFLIPEGYQVEYIPSDDSYDGTLLGYRIAYKRMQDKIILYKTYYIDYLLMSPTQFKIWNKEIGKLSDAYKETVVLKKVNK